MRHFYFALTYIEQRYLAPVRTERQEYFFVVDLFEINEPPPKMDSSQANPSIEDTHSACLIGQSKLPTDHTVSTHHLAQTAFWSAQQNGGKEKAPENYILCKG
jgi:hypothetical protein